MKNNFNYNFKVRIFVITILFMGLFSFYKSIDLKAYNNQDVVLTGFSNENTEINMAFDGSLKNISGWAWSPDIGWISLNCLNDFDGDNTNGELDDKCTGSSDVNYGVYWEDGKIKGCGWAPSISSWVCFSDPGGAYDGVMDGYTGVDINTTDYINSLDNEYGSGYASILGYEYLGGDEYKLAFPIEDPNSEYNASEDNPMNGCFNCWERKQCAQSGDDCSAVDNCSEEDGACSHVDNVCNSCLNYVYCTEPTGCNADGSPGQDYDQDDLITVYSSFGCSGCDSIDTGSCKGSSYAIADQGNLISCNECNQNGYETPGVILDNNPLIYDENDNPQEMYDLCGFAWNGFDIDGDNVIDSGVGYLQFSPRISYDFNPYFSVERGSIYAEDNITGTEYIRPGAYNARFLIKAGGDITNMLSSMGNQVGIMEQIDKYNFLSKNEGIGKYENSLGTVDIRGLSSESAGTINKYGSNITETQTTDINNKVILLDGATSYGSTEFSGSGVIIVEGDLTITGDITYEAGSIYKLSDIHSLVWIIEGDVNIEENVELISGTFIILGNDSGDPGHFNSCTSVTCSKQLIVNGSVIAKDFNLTRTFTAGAAEKFVNDGRLKVNPPAGLVDFSKALPRFSSDTY